MTTKSEVGQIDVCAVGALLHTADGKYLMQLRDDRPGLPMRGHWGLFGGLIEPGEQPAAALLRELREELSYIPTSPPTRFSQVIYELKFAGRGTHCKTLFSVPIMQDEVTRMQLGEGQAMRLFHPESLVAERAVTPWDWYGVILHSRQMLVSQALTK